MLRQRLPHRQCAHCGFVVPHRGDVERHSIVFDWARVAGGLSSSPWRGSPLVRCCTRLMRLLVVYCLAYVQKMIRLWVVILSILGRLSIFAGDGCRCLSSETCRLKNMGKTKTSRVENGIVVGQRWPKSGAFRFVCLLFFTQ